MIAEWASSDDRSVTVRAAPGGIPVEVKLEPAALQQRPEVLARQILETSALAGRRATRSLRGRLTTEIGPEANRTLDRVGLSAPAESDDADGDAAGEDYGAEEYGGGDVGWLLRGRP